MFRLSSFLETVQYRGWHQLDNTANYLLALCLSFLTHQICMIFLSRLPHKVVSRTNLNNSCENALKMFLKCHACLKKLFL